MRTDPEPSSGRVRFGDVEVDLESRELLRSGSRVRLQEKSFLVLRELLKSPGRVVTREELAAALWPREHFVDAEHGLNTAVRRLREALGDSADEARFVETLPRLGYRFIGTIEAAVPAVALPPADAPASASAAGSPSRRGALLAGASLLVLVLAAALVARSRSGGAGANPASPPSKSDEAVNELLARASYLRNHKRFDEAKKFVEDALKLDPRNGNAHAAYALNLGAEGKTQQAREEARRALELDPNAWEAYRLLGNLAQRAGDWGGAERYFRRSVETGPSSDFKARNRYARHLLEIGKLAEAKEQILLTKKLAPEDPDVQNIWMQYALLTGDYESAIRQGEIWLEIWGKQFGNPVNTRFGPYQMVVRQMLGLAYVGARRADDAVAQFRIVDPADDLLVALALGYTGRIAEARAILEARGKSGFAAPAAGKAMVGPPFVSNETFGPPQLAGEMAMVHVVIGDLDRAFQQLDRQVTGRSFPGWTYGALFEPIRRDPRWPAFSKRLEREFFSGEKAAPGPVVAGGAR